jgi:hypothetical protein
MDLAPQFSAAISPRQFTSGRHLRNSKAWVAGLPSAPIGATPLQSFANARLLLHQNATPGDTTSAVVAAHVLECFLERANYISAKENGPGVDTGDFTYGGMICRTTQLPPNPGAIWLSSELDWQQNGRRVATNGLTVAAPCEGWIWWIPMPSTPSSACWSSAPATALVVSVPWCSR